MKFKTNFKQYSKSFNSSMLQIGEMMQLDELCAGEVIIRSYDEFISLTNPRNCWDRDAILIGRKLLPGESVTLTQE